MKEETGLTVVSSSVKEYGYIHRIEKGKGSPDEIFQQDNFYYFCEAEESIESQRLEENEKEEEFVLEFVSPRHAIDVNKTHDHSSKKDDSRFVTRNKREIELLELLINEHEELFE